MNTADPQYLQLLNKLVTKLRLTNVGDGSIRNDRTGVGTVSLFGEQMRFNLAEGFPILTTKKVHFPSVVSELLWFLKGDTNIKYLLEHNNHIWTDWRYKAYLEHHKENSDGSFEPYTQKQFEEMIVSNPHMAKAWGDIGKGYGHQWRKFGEVSTELLSVLAENTLVKSGKHFVSKEGFDQISWVINEIKTNPTSRRLLVSGWNPQEMDNVDLPPCHTLFQFFVEKRSNEEMIKDWETKVNRTFMSRYSKDAWKSPSIFQEYLESLMVAESIPTSKLSCQLYQRSADIFLGVPFNIASYALLTNIIAKECGLGLGEFIWTGGDTHLYSNHLDQAVEQCSRSYEFDTPKLKPFTHKPFDQYEPSDFELTDYKHHPAIKAPVAV